MVRHVKSRLGRYFFLPFFDDFIQKFNHLATLQTDDVIMVFPGIDLIEGSTIFETMTNDNAGFLKLGQNPIDRRQTDFLTLFPQFAEDILSAEMLVIPRFQDTQNTNAGRSGF